MITLEINHKQIEVPEGTTVIDAAEQNGIYIPRFCYHKKLSIVANCRMCLVEVDGVPKPLPACATTCSQDMKVFTTSEVALKAQKGVMEFLLINHPLDCPICDQGGECELQDLAMGYGRNSSRYDKAKRAVENIELGPLVSTELTRCIQCTRCVRFGEEIAGVQEIGVLQRTDNEKIGVFLQNSLKSELSANVIDICPVGALTSKPYRFHARSWELKETPSVAPHDCVGGNIFVHTRGQEFSPERIVMRTVPRENEQVNENWASDRDRFSYLALESEERVLQPMRKRKDQWEVVDWEPALLEVADRTRAIVNHQGADQIAALASPSSTLEEMYLLQKLVRALGSNHIDHRLREVDFSDANRLTNSLGLGFPLVELEECQDILLVGSFLRKEQPMLNARVFKAHLEGANVMAINAMDYPFNYPLKHKMIVPQNALAYSLAQVAKALGVKTADKLTAVEVSAEAQAIADQLKASENAAIVLGSVAMQDANAAQLRALMHSIHGVTGCRFGVMTDGANGAGAYLAGVVPHRGPAASVVEKPGKNAKELLTTDPVRAYFILGSELENDCAYSAAALRALAQAGLVVCISSFVTEKMREYADFILPASVFTENSGTLVNTDGQWQSFTAASVPHGASRPAWKILRALGTLLELEGFEYHASENVRHELKELVNNMQPMPYDFMGMSEVEKPSAQLTRLGAWPMAYVDAYTRRADALVAAFKQEACVRINEKTAQALNVSEGDEVNLSQDDSQIKLPVKIDHRVADHTAFVASGLPETQGFGQAHAAIIVERRTSDAGRR